METKSHVQRWLSCLLAALLLCTATIPVFAEAPETVEPIYVISAFEPLSALESQVVPIGTTKEQLALPTELKAVYSIGDSQPEQGILAVSGWEENPEFNGELKGSYQFTPQFSEQVSLKEGVLLPTIRIAVDEPQPQAPDKESPVQDAAPLIQQTTSPAQEIGLQTAELDLTFQLFFTKKMAADPTEGLQIELNPMEKESAVFYLEQNGETAKNEIQASFSALNAQGEKAVPGEVIHTLHATFTGLPQGECQIILMGEGYLPSQYTIDLADYSKHLILSNDKGSFLVGDMNQDGSIDQQDLESMETHIGEKDSSFDLNGDGICDIFDLTAVYNNMDQVDFDEDVQLENTRVHTSKLLDITESANSLTKYGVPIEDAVAFLNGEERSIALRSENQITEENPVSLVLSTKEDGLSMRYMNLKLPAGEGRPTSGVIVAVTEDGDEIEVPLSSASVLKAFSPKLMSNSFLMAEAVAEPEKEAETITIDLGKRVVIKKITIKITGTQQNTTFANIAKVEFYQSLTTVDQTEQNRIRGFRAESSNESVILSWSALSNVSGYRIYYGLEPNVLDQTLETDLTSVKITNLENRTTYYFAIRAVNGDWNGPLSSTISCMPMPTGVPKKPGNLSVNPGNGMLAVSWAPAEDADTHTLYYKAEDAAEYIKITGLDTKTELTGLVNGTKYLMYVTGVNAYGEGPKSSEAAGVPEEIIYAEPEGTPTYNRLDRSHITGIKLTHPDHFDPKLYSKPFPAENVIDGDYTTTWVSRAWWEKAGFVVTFDQAYEMDHMVWISRFDGNYKKSLNSYTVEVWGPNDDLAQAGTVIVSGEIISKTGLSSKGVEILTFPKSEVKQIKVYLGIWNGAPTNTSASEIMFYQYYSIVDEVTALFADTLHTKLAEGVTAEQIAELQNRVSGSTGEFYVDNESLLKEIALAQSLLDGKKPENLLTVETGRDYTKDSDRGFSYTLNDFQPLGLVGLEKEKIVVYVEAEDAAKGMPSLVFSQYFAEYGAWNSTQALKQGRNVISVPKIGSGSSTRGGSMYITYHGEAQKIQMNILGGTKIPMLNLPEFTTSNTDEANTKAAIRSYLEQVDAYTVKINNPEKNPLNSTEIATKHVLLSIPYQTTKTVLNKYQGEDRVQHMYEELLAWEQDMDIHFKLSGLSADAAETRNQLPNSRINVRYMQMFGAAFMYAAGAHVGIGYGSCSGMLTAVPAGIGKTPSLFGWGINHEIGHVMDQRGLVYAETTNNIHSIYLQTFDGDKNIGTSRLEGGKWNSVYEKTSVSAPGKANDVFVQLAMYWQLHLAYDGAGDNAYDFYSSLYQRLRSGQVTAENQDDLFIKLACDTAKKDLRDFFAHWGFPISTDVNTYLNSKGYDKETRALWYLNDEAHRYRLNGKTGISDGTVINATAKLGTDELHAKDVTIEISGIDADALLGYEIFRNGKPIAFTTESTYVDHVSSLNNVALEYSVVGYDKLLNQTASVSAGAVRVQDEGLFDNTAFTYTKTTDGQLVITLDSVKQVSGMKMTGFAAKEFTVEIKNGNTLLSVQNRSITNDSELIYFEKPGETITDYRIWGYDADTLILHGDALAGISAEDLKTRIRPATYAGDDVSLTNDGKAIGRLKEDFLYGNGEKIAAGTIIVVGDFRGDPMYNALKLWGDYTTSPCANETVTNEQKLIGGEQLILAEVPADNIMTNVKNGMWIYIPSFALDEEGNEILPAQIKLELYRVDNPDTLENERMVSDTLWIPIPSEDTMPTISLTGGNTSQGGNAQ